MRDVVDSVLDTSSLYFLKIYFFYLKKVRKVQKSTKSKIGVFLMSAITTPLPTTASTPTSLLPLVSSYVIYLFNTDQRCIIVRFVPRPSRRLHSRVCPWFRRRLALATLRPHLRA